MYQKINDAWREEALFGALKPSYFEKFLPACEPLCFENDKYYDIYQTMHRGCANITTLDDDIDAILEM